MINFDEMSRDELVISAKSMWDQLLYSGNHPSIAQCPFCLGSGVVSFMKCSLKPTIIEEWNKDVTREEYDSFTEEMLKKYTPKAG